VTLAGIGYRRAHRDALLGADAGPDCLEIIPSHFFGGDAALAPLAERYPLVFHEVGLSIGTVEDSAEWISRMSSLVRLARPKLLSDHLALTRSATIDLGHLCPLFYDEETLAHVVARVRAWQAIFEVPIALENIAAPFVLPGAPMTEACFFRRLVDATGCGILMDLTNLVVNAENHGFDARKRLEEYPLEAVMQVHLAGGRRESGFYVDSHDAPVDEASYALLDAVKRRARDLVAVVVERDDKLPALAELVGEARRAS
jgi:uncharacterized protein (UPF0276 family)